VYFITPTSEEIARRLATRPAPATQWELETSRVTIPPDDDVVGEFGEGSTTSKATTGER
jgi:hypothetical protein